MKINPVLVAPINTWGFLFFSGLITAIFFGSGFIYLIGVLIDEPAGTTKYIVSLIGVFPNGLMVLLSAGMLIYGFILSYQAIKQPTLLQNVDPGSYSFSNNRLQNWDFDKQKVYLLQAVTFDRIPYLGKVVRDRIHLNLLGNFVKSEWLKLNEPKRDSTTRMGAFIILPWQFKAIVIIDAEHSSEDLIDRIVNDFQAVVVGFATNPWGFKKRAWTKGFSKLQIQNTEDFIKAQDEIIQPIAT